MRTLWLALGLGCGVVGFSLAACAGDTPALCDNNACNANADGGPEGSVVEGGADVVQPPAGCDAAADPKDAPKCVVSEFGVFVDGAGGSDSNTGTKESPVKSISAALGKLGGKARVYVCEGTYAEHVKLTSAVSLFGGFACGSWSYSGTKAKVVPTDNGLALELRGTTDPVVLSDLELTAKDATSPGESSIAAFVVSATKVTLRRSILTAGKGVDGTDGVAAADFAPANAPDGTGGAAMNPGAQTPNPACATSVGGAGGKDGATNGAAGQIALASPFPATSTGAGGTAGAVCAGVTDGSYGIAGTPGAGAAAVGGLDATGWKGADGAPGGAGGNGQGGGGGAQRVATGVGGSGGPGGCGGAGGAKGGAGGSSIALLVFQSLVVLEQSTLVAKDAGRGGNAAKGQKAQLGSLNPGAPSSFASACVGGIGGIGGSGGGGGGGAGGLSVGILYKGTAPTVDGVSTSAADTLASVTLGAKGVAGLKGGGGDAAQTSAPASRAGQDGSDGTLGDAKAVVSAP